jgi:vacuolar iron transporter family protein
LVVVAAGKEVHVTVPSTHRRQHLARPESDGAIDDKLQSSRHRNVRGSGARAAVLGAGDGLITNVSLVLGVAGASVSPGTVRLAGVASLLAGAFSMAAGELVSVRAQDELVQHELDVERDELAKDPNGEQQELAAMYRVRGVPAEEAATVARILMSNKGVALVDTRGNNTDVVSWGDATSSTETVSR